MRLLRFLLLEICIAAGSVLSVGTAVGWSSALVVHRLQDRAVAARMAIYRVPLPPRDDAPGPPEPAITDEPAGTFLGMADDLLIDRVRSQAITRVKLNKGGSSLSFRVEFADGSRAAFKPAQTNLQTIPRKEVAAYRLNRLLGLNAIPPAIPRAISREELLAKLHPDSRGSVPRIQAETIFNLVGKTVGVASYWIPEIKDSGLDTPEGIKESTTWLTVGAPIGKERLALASQFSDLVVFDFLTANPDRYSGGNMKMSPDGARLYFMDNTLAFFLNAEGHEKNRTVLERSQRFSRRLFKALDRVTEPELERIMSEGVDDDAEILTPAEIHAVVTRRQVAQRYVAALAQVYGEKNVLAFP